MIIDGLKTERMYFSEHGRETYRQIFVCINVFFKKNFYNKLASCVMFGRALGFGACLFVCFIR